MELFLLRHGHAEAEAPRDQDRPLSLRGREEVKETITSKQDEMSRIDTVCVSPYLRTQQTLAVVRELLNLPSDANTTKALTPSADPRALFPLLESLEGQSVLFVTHQPLVGTFLDLLCGFEPGRYRMGTSALAAIDVETMAAGLGEFRWLKQPH